MSIEVNADISHRKIGKFNNLVIDYTKDDPLEDWSLKDVFECLNSALALKIQNLEISTLIYRHLKYDNNNSKKVKNIILQNGAHIVPWLFGVKARIKNIQKTFKFSSQYPKNCKVYFILLNLDRETPQPWGLYIGETFQKVERRFSEHTDPTNKRRSRHVCKRGWQILYSLTSFLPSMTRSDAQKFEKACLASLRGELKYKTIKGLTKSRIKGG